MPSFPCPLFSSSLLSTWAVLLHNSVWPLPVIETRLEGGLTKGNMTDSRQPQLPATEINGGPVEGGPDGVKGLENESHGVFRKKVVVVGLGMVGISFM